MGMEISYYWKGIAPEAGDAWALSPSAMQSRKHEAAPPEPIGVLPPHRDTPLRKPPELAALARSVANHRWAEEALIESEERYRIVAETAIDAIVTIDEAGEILFVNRSAEKIFGYSTAEILGQNLTLLAPRYSRREDRGANQPREVVGRHKDGHEIPLEIAFGEFTQGMETLATGVLRDVSRRKRAEEARRRAEEELRHANETLRALIEATPLAIIAFDFSENISKWNSAAEKMFGWTEAEMLGHPLPFAPARQAERQQLTEAVRRGESITLETERQRKDGAWIDVNISAAPLAGPDGTPAGVVAVIADITDRKRLEDQVRQAQKMEAVGRLAGGIAHDFNNLLTVITGYDEMLLNNLAQDTRPRAHALEILHAAEKASALTKQLLAFSRRQIAHPALLDVNEIVTNLGKMLGRLIGEDIELALRLGSEVGTVRADPSQIEQIIINLAVNARDAMPGGGRITIETGMEELGGDQARAHFDIEPGRYVFFAVTDTGQGMTQKTLTHIFEPFFTTKGQGEGTGLGLSTIYGIVKQNNGDIRVLSEPGKGSKFTIYLPIVNALPEPCQSSAGRILQHGKETLLVVEDEAGLRLMIQELLERLGYTVLTAANTEEAIHITSLHPGFLHLLLTDVVMPKASGRELAERLRRLRRHTRVLYMSGYPLETVMQRGVLQTGAEFLEKPFTPEVLARKVREVLDAPMNANAALS
jgi:two-component system cell cycle sensor histidine kinase/response regulator CckA